MKQLEREAGIDERADINVARCHSAVERRINFFEAGKLLQTLYVRNGRLNLGIGRRSLRGEVVCILLGDSVALKQILIAGGLRFGITRVSLRSSEISLRLKQLLIDLGAFNNRKQLPLFRTRAYVEVPLFKVAISARIYSRIDVGLHVARKHKFLRGRAALWFCNDHIGSC